MFKRMDYGIVSIVCGIVLITGLCPDATWGQPEVGRASRAQGAQIGEVPRIEGTALMKHAGENRFQPIKESTPIVLEDSVATDQKSKAWCVVNGQGPSDQGHASLGENSLLEFVRYERSGASSQFSGNEGQGIIRYIKALPQTSPPSSFTIATPTALIEVLPSDRPADFVVEVVSDTLTSVYGIWGAVKVRHISEKFTQERIVRSCQKVDVDRDKEPSPVMGVSPEKLMELIKRTTIPNTLPEDVPVCRREATEWEEPPPILGCPCPPGEELVGDFCRSCARWQNYDPSTCSCRSRCRYDANCRHCEHCRDGRCVPIVCPPGEWLDPHTCRCRRQCPEKVHCPPGQWFNPQTCRCERRCEIKECPPNQWFDKEHCRCVTKTEHCRRICPPGQTLNLKTCTCEPKCHKTCQPGEWLDYKTCECRPKCNKSCPQGQRLNRETCNCEPVSKPCTPRQCPPGQTFDHEKCKCIGELTIKKPEGCRSDSDCGPNSTCRNGRCFRIERTPLEPKLKIETPKHLIEPTTPSRPTPPGRQFQETPRQLQQPGKQLQQPEPLKQLR